MSELTTVPESRFRTLEPIDAAIMQVLWRYRYPSDRGESAKYYPQCGGLGESQIPTILMIDLAALGSKPGLAEVERRLAALREAQRIELVAAEDAGEHAVLLEHIGDPERRIAEPVWRIDAMWPCHYAAETVQELRRWWIPAGGGYVLPNAHHLEFRRRVSDIMWACYVSLEQLQHDTRRGYEAMLGVAGRLGRVSYETGCTSLEVMMRTNKGISYTGPTIDVSILDRSVRALCEVFNALRLIALPATAEKTDGGDGGQDQSVPGSEHRPNQTAAEIAAASEVVPEPDPQSKAMAILTRNPELTNLEIANRTGVHPSTLYRKKWGGFRKLRKALKATPPGVTRQGSRTVDKDTGHVSQEVWSTDKRTCTRCKDQFTPDDDGEYCPDCRLELDL